MKNEYLRLEIPEPCSEKWSDMKAVDELHRHCNSCNRVLTDFSQMSDTELVLWLKHSKGKVCGQFDSRQLNKNYLLPATRSKPKYWLNALWLLPLSWFAADAKAQTTQEILKSKPVVSVPNGNSQPETTELQSVSGDTLPAMLKGVVLDKETNEPLPFVAVYVQLPDGSRPIGTTTDMDGRYMLKLPPNLRTASFTLVFTYVGYNRKEIQVSGFSATNSLNTSVIEVKLDVAMHTMTIGIMITTSPAEAAANRDRSSIWSKMRLGLGFGKF